MSPSPRLPIAVSPTPAVLPIRQTSTQSRPAGIDLPIAPTVPGIDAFHPPTLVGTPMVPIAIPAPPIAPPELAAPVAPTLDPAMWGLDIEAAPAPGRRRGSAEAEPERRGGGRKTDSSMTLPVRLLGRGKAGAARLLVLALVVGAEGVAVTAMAGTAHTAPIHPSTDGISNAFELSADQSSAGQSSAGQGSAGQASTGHTTVADTTSQLAASTVLAESAERQQAQVAAQQASLDLQQAQDEASQGKVTAALAQAKAAADRVKAAADRRARAMRRAQSDPKSVARLLASDRGWGSTQFTCLVSLWNRESGWNFRATNAGSGAYGIPQSLPGGKMASAGADWRTNPVTQIKWGLQYISSTYGTPCGAWGHSQATGWY